MVGAYESSAGWTFWNFANEMGDPRWSFFDAQDRGWFPKNLSAAAYAPRMPDCATHDSAFGSFLVTIFVALGSSLIAAVCGCWLVCDARRHGRAQRQLRKPPEHASLHLYT